MWHCFLAVVAVAAVQTSGFMDNPLEYCIDSKHHKHAPGPESSLFDQCSPWKERSCCTENVTRQIHQSNLYNFNFDHCAQKREMSDKCRRHFKQDNCFYECSPNVGPWMVKENRKWRQERFYHVPLCNEDCKAWFSDCSDDYTCTDNWSRNFDWRNTTEGCWDDALSCKQNFCPAQSTCETFETIYGTAENFCEKVWDGSWQSTESDKCMRLWFDGSKGNPNDAIARHYANMVSAAAPTAPFTSVLVAGLGLVWSWVG